MFKPKTSRVAPALGTSAGGLAGAASSRTAPRLSFYVTPPTDEVTIAEFEGWALDRLQVLKAIETAGLRRNEDPKLLQATVNKYLPLSASGTESKDAFLQRKKDNVSHFILRLAFARTEDLRAWFMRMEEKLFRLRWEACYENEKAEFVNSLKLDLERVDREVSFKGPGSESRRQRAAGCHFQILL